MMVIAVPVGGGGLARGPFEEREYGITDIRWAAVE